MSRASGSAVIQIAVILAIVLLVLPVSADNITTNETAVAPPETTIVTPMTTVSPAETAVAATVTTAPPTETAIVTTVTAAPPPQTTVAPPQATAPVTLPTTIFFTPTQPVTSTAPIVTTGSISVYSSPAGASILIDGAYSGTTPKTVNGVPAGNHILRLSLSGYHDYEGSIYVVAGQTAQGYGTLQPVSQEISAAQTPDGVVPVFIPVITATPVPAEDPGLLGNPSIVVAIIGVITALIAGGVSVFTHVKPPKKE